MNRGDRAYFMRRVIEEEIAAATGRSPEARCVHAELAMLYKAHIRLRNQKRIYTDVIRR